MRFLALLSLLFLSACSDDSYHYYYSCLGDKILAPSGPKKNIKDKFHLYDKKLRTYNNADTLFLESYKNGFWTFIGSQGGGLKREVVIDKYTNEIVDSTFRNDDAFIKYVYKCSVEKTLFAK